MFVAFMVVCPVWAASGDPSPAGDPLASSLPSIQGVTMLQGGSSLAVLEVTGNLLPSPDILSTGDNVLVLLWSGVYLPSAYWERAFATPLVQSVTLKQEPDGVHMTVRSTKRIALGKTVGDPPTPVMSVYLSTPDSANQIPLSPAAPPRTTVGDPLAVTTLVTLELRDTDLRDVFRMLGGLVNMNIIVDPSVPPMPVTVSLNQVPMNEAFGYLMRMYDVSYAMMGKTIIVGKKENISRTMGMERTRSFHLAYADPKQIPALLQGISGVSNIVVDERLRTIYVTASEERLQEVASTLQRIDHPGTQVMLQARIIEVSEGGSDEMQSLINAVYERWYSSISSLGGVIGYFDDNGSGVYDPGTTDRAVNPPESITFPDLSGSVLKFFDAGFQILVTENKAKMLASPSVVTIDGQKATIKLVSDVKYVSGKDEAGNPTYGDVEAGPVLEFTPIVGRSDIVTLELSIKTGEVVLTTSASGIQYPESSTREVQTTVRVRDGEPFVVGGLFNETKSENTWKIPVIADIPLLGELFKGRSKTVTKSEVIMIVVPYILEVPESQITGSDVKVN
ncbi:MAG: secretin N-terminal domain-containing protein [Thermovirgaceae bacterium]|nr:secretin N-terminal domain-containing protein [Thermovirgaceae bacterium]